MEKEKFTKKYCRECGTQRCEGPDSEWFSGCKLKSELQKERNSMTKQYTIEQAYTGNQQVTLYHDGKKVDYDIVADYDLSGYLQSIENRGYERAFDEDYYMLRLRVAEEHLREAQANLERAQKHPLMKAKE